MTTAMTVVALCTVPVAAQFGSSGFGARAAAAALAGVTPDESTVTLSGDGASVRPGQALRFHGQLSPAEPGRTVRLQQKTNGLYQTVDTVTTNGSGAFTARTTAPSSKGHYEFRAAVADNGAVPWTTTSPVSTITVGESRISATFPATTNRSWSMKVSGTVTPPAARTVELQYQDSEGTWVTLGSAPSSASNGKYVVSTTDLTTATSHLVRTSVTETDSYYAATSPERTVPYRYDQRRITLHLSASAANNRGTVWATGRLTPPAKGVRVSLRHELPGTGEPTLAHAVTNASGKYRIKVPTWWSATQYFVVTTSGTHAASASKSATRRLAVRLPYRSSGSSRSYALYNSARWNPCRVLTYRLNLANAPSGTGTLVRSALTDITTATGIRFRYVGTTSHVPYAKKPGARPADADLVLAWSTVARVPKLKGYQGLGGSSYQMRMVNGKQVPYNRTKGSATFNFPPSTAKKLGTGVHKWLILHEVGHALGLAHTSDVRAVMYGGSRNANQIPRRFMAGDLAGLRKVGMSQGCR